MASQEVKLIRIHVHRAVQNRKTFYLATLKCKYLLKHSGESFNVMVDEWDPIKNPYGYQRKASQNRIRTFAKYVAKKKEVFQTPLLISIRNPEAKFIRENNNTGYLVFPNDAELYIVDGAHRWRGLLYLESIIIRNEIKRKFDVVYNIKELYNMDVVVVFILPFEYPDVKDIDSARELEAYYFTVINETAKKTRSSLSNEFLKRASKKTTDKLREIIAGRTEIDRRRVAAKVASYLIEQHPVVSKFNLKAGKGRDTFIKSIVVALRRENWLNRLKEELQEVLEDIEDTVKSYYDDYWNAIANVYPEAFKSSTMNEYVFHSTIGYVPLNRLLPYIITKLEELNLDVTQENIELIFRKLPRFSNSSEWKKNSEIGKKGTSEKAFKEVEDLLKAEVDNALRFITRYSDVARLVSALKNKGLSREDILDIVREEHGDAVDEDFIDRVLSQ